MNATATLARTSAEQRSIKTDAERDTQIVSAERERWIATSAETLLQNETILADLTAEILAESGSPYYKPLTQALLNIQRGYRQRELILIAEAMTDLIALQICAARARVSEDWKPCMASNAPQGIEQGSCAHCHYVKRTRDGFATGDSPDYLECSISGRCPWGM
jgi:hypothetical protein